MLDTTGIETDIDRVYARQSGHATSFRPEHIGNRIVDDYIRTLKDFAEWLDALALEPKEEAIKQEVFDRMREKLKQKTEAWIYARSRCISPIITGPANFPLRRAQKANAAEGKRCAELCEFTENMYKYARKSLKKVWTPQETQAKDIARLKNYIASAKAYHEHMKAANAAFRKGDEEKLKDVFVKYFPETWELHLRTFKKPNFMGKCGYESYMLTNNLETIKRKQARLDELEKKAQKIEEGADERKMLKGLEIVRNYEADRLQLLFTEKPEEEVRGLLKRNGFRWSPRFGAWQRKLTSNATHALKRDVLGKDIMSQYIGA